MTIVEAIENQMQHLDNLSFAALRAWFFEYEHLRRDRQIAADSDSDSGALDSLIAESLAEHKAGTTRPL
jgi:uncharacterized protein YjaZ